MTKEQLVERILAELETDAECDNVDSIYDLCIELVKEAKVKTLKRLVKEYCIEDEDEEEE